MDQITVGCWLSHPDLENDDCQFGADFQDIEAALEYFNSNEVEDPCIEYIEIAITADLQIGPARNLPEIYQIRKNPQFRPRKKERDNSWQREIANEAGMLHGVEGYNEVMGW